MVSPISLKMKHNHWWKIRSNERQTSIEEDYCWKMTSHERRWPLKMAFYGRRPSVKDNLGKQAMFYGSLPFIKTTFEGRRTFMKITEKEVDISKIFLAINCICSHFLPNITKLCYPPRLVLCYLFPGKYNCKSILILFLIFNVCVSWGVWFI